jgi:hypothetical protein
VDGAASRPAWPVTLVRLTALRKHLVVQKDLELHGQHSTAITSSAHIWEIRRQKMDLGRDDSSFETEDIPSHSHPEHALEPSSLPITYINSHHPVGPPQSFPVFDGTLGDSAAFTWPEPSSATFFSLSPLHCSASGNIAPPDHTAAYNFSSFRQNHVRFQGQIVLPSDRVNIGPPNPTAPDNFFLQQIVSSQSQIAPPILDQPVNQHQPAQLSTNKRARKASTMSTMKWAPHKNRMRQLYVSEAKSLEELREVMNRELGMNLT